MKKRIKYIPVVIAFVLLFNPNTIFGADTLVIGYYPDYKHTILPAEKFQLEHLTHVIHSFIADKLNLNKLVSEIRQKNADLRITMAVPGSNWRGQYYDFDFLKTYVDWFGCMAYDMHGSWSSVSGHNAPLYAFGGAPSVESYINYLNIIRNVPEEKIVLGIPFYGWLFNSSSLGGPNSGGSGASYIDAAIRIIDEWTYFWDDLAKVPYLIDSNNTKIISFDDINSIEMKCDYAKSRNLAGVMIWEISHDYLEGDQPLLETVGMKMLQSLGQLTASVDITLPGNNFQYNTGDTVNISATASDSTGMISKVEFYSGSIKIGESLSEPYEYNWVVDTFGVYVLKALAYNNLQVATPSERIYIRVLSDSSEQAPFLGIPFAIPGIIEAEDFDVGGEGVSYHDTTPGNTGGSYRTNVDVDIEPCCGDNYDVGWIVDDEWLEYTIDVDSAGLYDIEFSVASALNGGSFHLELNGQDITQTINTPGTGAWGIYEIITTTGVAITAGEYILRFQVESGDFNLNNMIFYYPTVGVEDETQQPKQYMLSDNYPNPFNPTTNIFYSIHKSGLVEIKVFNTLGQEVTTLINEFKNSGEYSV
jgi:hypothetical protein